MNRLGPLADGDATNKKKKQSVTTQVAIADPIIYLG